MIGLLSLLLLLVQQSYIQHEQECIVYAARLAEQQDIQAILYDSGVSEDTGYIVDRLVDQQLIPSADVRPDYAFGAESSYGRVNNLFFSTEEENVVIMYNLDTNVWCVFLAEKAQAD